MAVPYMFGPGGQPILMGQIPILPQQQFPVQQSVQPPQSKAPEYMSEEKLQDKGISN